MQDRDAILLKGITKSDRGIEVAPWFSPRASKRAGYDCLSLDVFDTETLRRKGLADPNIGEAGIGRLEDVDLVGSASDIADLVAGKYTLGSFDYIVSSHNFEHLPDPIRFLQGCQAVLRPGGCLTMAVPDRRCCFDYFRPLTMVGDWLTAFAEQRKAPTPAQVFATNSCFGGVRKPGRRLETSFSMTRSPAGFTTSNTIEAAYATFLAGIGEPSSEYRDAHCTVMTPASLELMLLECRQLGLINFRQIEVSTTVTSEFFARLTNASAAETGVMPATEFATIRNRLLHKVVDENAMGSAWAHQHSRLLPRLRRQAAELSTVARFVAGRVRSTPINAAQAIWRRISS